MNKSEYKKIDNCWNSAEGKTNRQKIDAFYTSEELCIGTKKPTKKNKKKSDHKHNYQEVLLRYSYIFPLTGKETKNLCLGKRCLICGLIKETGWIISEKLDGYSRPLTYSEILEKYSNLEIVDYDE